MNKAPLADFAETFQSHGLRLTHQRLEIFKTLLADHEHPSAEKLFQKLRRKLPTISLDTVYRNLHTMEEHGLVRRVFTENNQSRFEARHENHHHLVCRQCQRIVDIDWQAFDQLDEPVFSTPWGNIENRHATLSGICESCLKKAGKNQKP